MGKRLENKIAVITGGTSGIGERTAEIFVEQGASVVIAGRSSEKGNEITDRLGDHAVFIRTDVTQESDVKNMIKNSVERFGRIDCLFNNAGAPGPIGPIEEITLTDVNAAISLLFGSVFLGMKYVAPVMKRQGSGSIINNASVAGIRVGFGPTIYSAAKAAVIRLTKCVAMELAPFGVRVNSISPGAIATPIIGKAMGLDPVDADRSVGAIISYLKERLPMQRSGLPDDIAYGALYLASEEGSFVTGHDLVIDTGITAGRTIQEQAMLNEKLAEVVLGASGR